ncbi:MAG: DUF433 domain-containing protein [Acidobacteriota bacterium]
MSIGRPAAKNDSRNQPAYPIGEAARYLRLPPATLRAWTLGRPYPTAKGAGHFRPLIRPASTRPMSLSFWNLIEAHVLRALRTDHGVSIKAVRQAVDFAERKLDVDRLLLRPELRSEAGQLFLDRYGQLVNLSASGQLALRQVLDAHLHRVSWDATRFPFRLHPFVLGDVPSDAMLIAIDPSISFGRPVVLSGGISTATIVERIDAGEQPADLADDYGLALPEIEQAVVYERAA